MKTSEQIDKIVPALLKAQQAIGAVVKDKTGKVLTKSGREYEYKYSDLASVIEHVKGPLNENGIVFIQTLGGDATGISVTTRLFHESGQWLEGTIYMAVQGSPQVLGSAITYSKRYSLQSMTGLPSEDDDGKAAGDKPNGADRPNTANQGPRELLGKPAYEACDTETQKWLHETKDKLEAMYEDPKRKPDMGAYLEDQGPDTEQLLALAYLMGDSGPRNELKRQLQSIRLQKIGSQA